MGFGGSQPGAGRPPNPKPSDIIRQRVEAELDAILEPIFSAAKSGDLMSARELFDRSWGKPKQTSEISGPDGGPLTIEQLAAKAIEP